MKDVLMIVRDQLKMGYKLSFAEAMLLQKAIDILVNKAGNSPAIPDGYMMVPKEPTSEMVKKMRYHVGSYDRNIKDGYKAMLAAAPQPQNAQQNIPEIIPGWIALSEQIPDLDTRVLLYFSDYGGHIEDGCIGDEGDGPYHYFFDGDALSHEPTHWMKLPEPPNDGN